MKPKIYVTRKFPQVALDLLATRSEVGVFPEDGPMPKEELLRAVQDIEGLLVAGARISPEVLEHAPKLRALSNASVGHDNLDLAAWSRDAIALALPDKILCRADCAGLCPVCGKNLNTEPHTHEDEPTESRWAALESLREKL